MAFFHCQAALPQAARSYVERRADRELLNAILEGEFCYVLTSRQMGKSSLLVHTAARLRTLGHRVVLLDFMGAGTQLTAEQWYDSLIVEIGLQLGLSEPLEDFWLDHQRRAPVQRFFDALDEVVLPRLGNTPEGTPSKLVVFVDEVDTVKCLSFYVDEFFAGIRENRNSQARGSAPPRLAFALFGIATLAELIRDPLTTPFLVGRAIELEDFTTEEAATLASGLARPGVEPAALLSRVLDWTHGHPYLTQRLCQAIADDATVAEPADVDRVCHATFLSNLARASDPNLAYVRDRLLRSPQARDDALKLYQRIRQGQAVPDDEGNPAVAVLRLSGIVRLERGLLVLHNRIYAETFDEAWLRSLPIASTDVGLLGLAVVPFVDISTEPSPDLCEGLTEELARAIGKMPGIRVLSRGSTVSVLSTGANPQELARELGATLVLRGRVRRLGRRVQVTAELLQARENRQVWSGTFRHGVEAWRQLQDDITVAVFRQLEVLLQRPAPSAVSERKPPANPEAHNLYLKGLVQRNRRTHTGLRRSLALFRSALELDPRYAPAFAGLAEAYLLLSIYNLQEPQQTCPQAQHAALRALELDDSLDEAHRAVATLHSLFERDFESADTSYRRALELNPNSASTRQWYAIFCLTPTGRHEEALEQLRRALEVDPRSPSIPTSAALALHFAGRPQEAIDQAHLALEMAEDFWLPHLFLGWIHEQAGRFEEGARALDIAVELSNRDPAAVASLAHLLARQGALEPAIRLLEELLAVGRTRYVPPAEVALVQIGLNRKAEARDWFEKARQDHSFRLVYSRVDPRMTLARRDPSLAPWL